MALVSMNLLMSHALANKYAVGYFEAWNMESILAVVDAAQQTKSPVIIGFGGQFIGSKKRTIKENIYHYGCLGKAIAEDASVPVALLLNEAHEVPLLIHGMNAGFNAVMFEGNGMPMEEFIKINQYLVRKAHSLNAFVEAEVGRLPDSDISTNTISEGEMTDPDEAAHFVKETGIDALAVAVGNVHLLEGKKASLDFNLIKKLRKKIKIPLVLHGGTGVADDDLKFAVELGMCKVNVGTILKRAYIKSIQNYLKEYNVEKMDPHNVIGRGGELDMLCAARASVCGEVVRYIKTIGSENMAKLI
ncbi:MAG: class II fructose-bisphosphate aldolase [Flavitalea sp.]